MSDFFWSVDSLVIKDNSLFGFGWAFHAKHEITSLRFKLDFTKDNRPKKEYITADAGKPREDVEHAFQNQPNALNSGFVVFGAFPKGVTLESIYLICTLADNSFVEFLVPASSMPPPPGVNDPDKRRAMLRQFFILSKRGLNLIRSGNFTSLIEKLRRYLKGRPKSALKKASDILTIIKDDECKDLCLIIDHDLGGGANHYRDRLVESIIKEGRSVIILTFHVATLSHVLILKNKRVDLRYSISGKEFLLDVAQLLSIKEIYYNTAVSFVRPEEIPTLLVALKKITSAQLKILVHDFFLICPSHFLIDQSGKHCHIPDISVCNGCLQNNQQGFATLYIDRDMPKWRSLWGAALSAADEIITFSNNTTKLLTKAYPQIDLSKISMIPHKVHHLPGGIPQIKNTKILTIGIVGHIGFHKGSIFVKALAQEIKRRNSNIKIFVIGTIEASCEPSVVSQSGAYRHDELPSIIEKTGANIMLFPSICPETFSYVIQELMEMKLPIASFNFGAPAERLASYPKGFVLDSMDPGIVLDDLISFHSKTYLAS